MGTKPRKGVISGRVQKSVFQALYRKVCFRRCPERDVFNLFLQRNLVCNLPLHFSIIEHG